MNIFQLKTQPEGIERVDNFIKDNFICIGYANTGSLRGFTSEDIRDKLKEMKPEYTNGQLSNHLGIVNAFINTMKKNDFVLITKNNWVYIGKVDQYDYDSDYIKEGMSHRRKVEWLTKVEKYQLNEYLRELLRNRSILTKFKHPYDMSGLSKVLNCIEPNNTQVSNELITKALETLEIALKSENEETRVYAASAILNYMK